MTATLNFQIRDHMRELYPEHRLGVLTMLMLHCDVRNRCWPSVDLLAHEMKLSPSRVSKAKQWLLAQGAIELVPYDKRVGEELKLPSRQHVYQLTGKIKIGDKVVPYLYFQAPVAVPEINPSNAGNFKVSDGSNTSIDNTTIGRGSINPSEVFPPKSSLPEVVITPPAVVEIPVASKPKKPSINQCLKDAVAIHVQEIAPDEGTAMTGLLANKALAVWKRKRKKTSATAQDYAEIAASIPVFVKWYNTVGNPNKHLPTTLNAFEDYYTKFPINWRSNKSDALAEFGLDLKDMIA